MKNNLKNATRTLSNYELNVLLPILKKGLETKKGKANAVTSRQIVMGLRNHGLKVNTRSVYMLINYIRKNDLIVGLMGSSVGYYIANNKQEFIDYEKRLLGREMELRKVRLTIKRQRSTLHTQFSPRKTQIF